MKILVAGNKSYGLAKSLYEKYPQAYFLSRSSGWDFSDQETQKRAAELSLDYDVFLSISCLNRFNQLKLVQSVSEKWVENDHKGYLIALGSSADTPVNGNTRIYPVEKKALRSYLRQLSQICSSETPKKFKVTYLSPGNLHTPSMDKKFPDTPKLDCDYVVNVIQWLLEQPMDVNISELCLDKIQRSVS